MRYFDAGLKVFFCALCLFALLSASGCAGNLPEIPEGYLPESGSLLFDEAENSELYNYCPSVFEEDGVRHIYYCSNTQSGVIKDFIACRRGILRGGIWYYGPKEVLLSPTPDTFDAMHTCDPSVVKGSFSYRGEGYSYLMAYLGCVTADNQQNEIGLAVARAPEGPWIKTDAINPIVPHLNFDPERTDVFQWGYGQPSLISADRAGRVILSYTMGTVSEAGIRMELWDFSDLSAPAKLYSKNLSIRGIPFNNSPEQTYGMSNADIAYDPVKNRLYLVGDSHPFSKEGDPTFVAAASFLGYIGCESLEDPGADPLFPNGAAEWKTVAFLGGETSGYPRNHNCGLVTDEYGHVTDPGKIEAVYTVSEINKPFYSLWTYRIHRAAFTVE